MDIVSILWPHVVPVATRQLCLCRRDLQARAMPLLPSAHRDGDFLALSWVTNYSLDGFYSKHFLSFSFYLSFCFFLSPSRGIWRFPG